MGPFQACGGDREVSASVLRDNVTSIVLTTLVVGAIFLLVRLFKPDPEASVGYKIELPPQLKPDYAWDKKYLNETIETPLIQNGSIHPICPADGRPLSPPISPATPSEIDAAIHRAQTAQHAWSRTTFGQRRRVLATLLSYVLDHQEEIVSACCLDSGKTKIDACFGEILVTAEKLQWTIRHGERALAPSRRPTNLLMCYKTNRVVYEPLGVVAACVSWNYPFHNFISPTISALFAGNGIVVKPSEQTCWSSLYFLSIIRGALEACGHSPELVQGVICLPEVADYLTSHGGISHITFIGSREVAHKVCASAAKALTPVTVELGGKDPAIVLDDGKTVKNVKEVADILMRGVFQSAGQNCIGIERVIALPRIHDLILSQVTPLISSLRLGSITHSTSTIDTGSLISSQPISTLESLIQAAVSSGAKLHTGGYAIRHPSFPSGSYFPPTLLSSVTPNMEIARRELFSPVFLLMRAENVAEAIGIANSTAYGLGASVFGHDAADVRRCVQELQAGMVSVNDFGSYYACSLPFGGCKKSGYGRFGGHEGLRALCNVKAICEDARWAQWLGLRTQIPPPLQYPIADGANGWKMCKGVVETGYAIGLAARVRGICRLISAAIVSTPSPEKTRKKIA